MKEDNNTNQLYENKPKRKWFHYLFALPIYFLIIIITSSFTFFFSKNKDYPSLLKFILCSIYYYSITMVIISHYISMTTNNSFQPSQFDTEICKKCQLPRPPRAHHCKICGVCIKRMDHHCPWIVNCVGENNQKSFILLLFYGFICCSIGSMTLMKPFKYVLINQTEINSTVVVNTFTEQLLVSAYFTLPIVGFILATIMSLMLIALMTSQIQFLMYNVTMVEWKKYAKKTESPYYNNNFKQNFIELFGENIIWWFIPFNSLYETYIYSLMSNYIYKYQLNKEYKPIQSQEQFDNVV